MDAAALMQAALGEARAAGLAGEVPVGAVVAKDGVIVGRGANRTLRDCDPTAHAELVALRAAALALGNHRLTGSVLVTTLEPCLMCCGAAVHARVAQVTFGALDEKAGATSVLADPDVRRRLNHQVAVDGGIGAEESAEMLRAFFRARRG